MTTTELNAKIDELWAQTKAGNLPREERFKAIEMLTEDYFASTGMRPEPEQLDRLATLCLYEEVTDDTAWKSRQTEYPFLSDDQLARRKDGVHQRKNEAGQREVALEKAWSVATDGRDNRTPKRRERSDNENIQMDNNVRSRNRQRQKVYREFTAVQPVITYKLSELEAL
jgi:hypothetical protein